MNWEIVTDPCPALGPNNEICQDRAGHPPIDIPGVGTGDHYCTDWADGEISGCFTWRERDRPRCHRGHFATPGGPCEAQACRDQEARDFEESVRDAWLQR